MKINEGNKTYTLDTRKAIDLGVMVEDAPITIQLTPDETIVLNRILNSIGGSPLGARGCCDSVDQKIRAALKDRAYSTDLNLEYTQQSASIYFKV